MMDKLLEKIRKPPPKQEVAKPVLTNWFSAKEPPTREGWYETKSRYHPTITSYPDHSTPKSQMRCRMLWWTGTQWLTGRHGILTRFGQGTEDQWRGLSKE